MKHFSRLLALVALPVSVQANITHYGLTGLYHTPNADVLNFGDLTFSYNNLLIPSMARTSNTEGENYNIVLSPLANVEGGIRLLHTYDTRIHTERDRRYGDFYTRDLSANIKFQIPYISNENARFAVGMTDTLGLAVNFRRVFAVASYQWRNLDFSLGYSHLPGDSRDNGLLKGAFYSAKYQPLNWLALGYEKESDGQRVGTDLIWQNPFGWAGSIFGRAVLLNDNKHEDPHFQIGVQLPIGGKPSPGSDIIERFNEKHASDEPANDTIDHRQAVKQINTRLAAHFPETLTQFASEAPVVTELKAPAQAGYQKVALKPKPTETETDQSRLINKQSEWQELTTAAENLVKKLENKGLDAVRVGVSSDTETLIIGYENRLFNWAEIDALAAVINVASQDLLVSNYRQLHIITQKNQLAILSTQIKTQDLSNLTEYAVEERKAIYAGSLIDFKAIRSLPEAAWLVEPTRNSKLNLTLTLAYKAYYGTEWSNWDYSVALRPVFRAPLWHGAHLSNVYHVGTTNSIGFREGVFQQKAFEDQMNELMIHQTFQPLPGLVHTVSAGHMKFGSEGFLGYMNQGEYQAFDGHARLYWRQGDMHSNKLDMTLDYRAIGLEGNIHALNLTAGVQTGDYIEGDRSMIYYGRTRFGNAWLNLGLTQSDITWERVDLSVSFPLGPRKNLALGPVTLGGDPAWYTGLGTVTDNPIAPKNNLIDINPGYKLVGASLGNSFSQHQQVFDNGRLTPAYLRTHYRQLLDSLEFTR